MERSAAIDYARFTALELCPVLETALVSKLGLHDKRFFLESARDRLYQKVHGFTERDPSLAHEDCYFHLFDALGLLTEGIRVIPMNRQRLLGALAILKSIEAKGALAPGGAA